MAKDTVTLQALDFRIRYSGEMPPVEAGEEFECPVEVVDQVLASGRAIRVEAEDPALPADFPHKARLVKKGFVTVGKVAEALREGDLADARFGKSVRAEIGEALEALDAVEEDA